MITGLSVHLRSPFICKSFGWWEGIIGAADLITFPLYELLLGLAHLARDKGELTQGSQLFPLSLPEWVGLQGPQARLWVRAGLLLTLAQDCYSQIWVIFTTMGILK